MNKYKTVTGHERFDRMENEMLRLKNEIESRLRYFDFLEIQVLAGVKNIPNRKEFEACLIGNAQTGYMRRCQWCEKNLTCNIKPAYAIVEVSDETPNRRFEPRIDPSTGSVELYSVRAEDNQCEN